MGEGKEIEAKYALDAEAVAALSAMTNLGGYHLGPARQRLDEDTYLDTRDGAILRGGYACRLRRRGAQRIVTLKAAQRVEGAVHHREEWEVEVGSHAGRPEEWPAGVVRDLALRLSGGVPLVPRFTLRQTRQVRDVLRGGLRVAEWSLDQGTITAGEQTHNFLTLEVELVDAGAPDDLGYITQTLGQLPGLRPEPRSKFELGLALVEGE